MTPLQALVLGLLQGLTEFLPVSSSGHLVIAQTFMEFDTPPIFFDIIVHVGTLVAVLVFFRHRLLHLSQRLLLLTAIGTIPAVIAGIVLEPYLETLFTSINLVAFGLLITTVLLLVTHNFTSTSTHRELSPKTSFIIGLFQALAIVPGISRSGASISAGLYQSLSKQDAFFFSFLLSIPAILGALVMQLLGLNSVSIFPTSSLIIGLLSSIMSGLLAIKLLKLVLDRFKFHYFALYTFFLSLLLLGTSYF